MPKIGEKVVLFRGWCFDIKKVNGTVGFVYKNGNIDAYFKDDGERHYMVNLELGVKGEERSRTYLFAKK